MPNQGDVHIVYAKAGKACRAQVTWNERASGAMDKTAGCGARTPAGEPEQVRARGPQPGGEDRRAPLVRQRSNPAARLAFRG